MSCSRVSAWLVVAVCLCGNIRAHESESRYGVVVDAGSTGSRARAYRWQPQSTGLEVVMVAEYTQEPGVDDFSQDPAGLEQYLRQLMNGTKDLLDEEFYADAPLYFMATGGVRALDGAAADDLMTAIRGHLENPDLNPFTHAKVLVLSGNEEAFYMWVAANYLAGFFGDSEGDDVGILELGGSSVQISFVSPSFLQMNKVIASIQHQQYNLYSNSYLTFGQTSTVNKIRAHVLSQDPTADTIKDPCGLKGDQSHTFTAHDGQTYPVEGTGDVTECSAIIDTLLFRVPEEMCITKPCQLAGSYLPTIPASTTFFALGVFKYSLEAVGALGEDGTVKFSHVQDKAQVYCGKTYSEVRNETGRSDQYMSSDCAMALYIPALLQHGLGFDDGGENQNVIDVSGEMQGMDIDWSLGAVIYQEAQYPEDPAHKSCLPVPNASQGLLASSSTVLMLLSLIMHITTLQN